MDPGVIFFIIALVLLLFLSAFFSSAETALTTVSKISMKTLADEGNHRAALVLKITDDSSRMLSAVLIGNNLVNILASSLATVLAVRAFGSAGTGIATGVLTLLVLIFGELTPKTMATIRAERMSLRYCRIIWVLMHILTPVIFILNLLASCVLRLLRVNPEEKNKVMTERELRTVLEVGHQSGVIETEEKQIINNVFDFGEAKAEDIMVQRIDMVFVQIDASYDEVVSLFREEKLTRLPVYEDSRDEVVGILNMKDLILCDRDSFSVRGIMREPFFTYEHKSTAGLLLQMRKLQINIAIVLDEYGMTAGLVTIQDLIEEIVGEIRDDYDEDEDELLQQISGREYLVAGHMKLDDFNEALHLNLESDGYDTIGGYLIGLLDRLPKVTDSGVTPDGVYLQVWRKEKQRIAKIYVRLPEKAPAGQEEV
ncbi:MAG: hemolysin family protein [Clostridiales bacterium]|nr:hemolysin family protein [Clostridiales bacterium]MCD8108550.1 hemolysin family protein [Clostridiales bacterium]